MPFQSEKQRRYLHANHPEIAKRWEEEYATGGIANHFRKKFKKGSYSRSYNPGAGGVVQHGPIKTKTSNNGGGGGSGGGGPPSVNNKPKGPTAAERAAAKAKAEAEKKRLEAEASRKYVKDFKNKQKKKGSWTNKLKNFGNTLTDVTQAGVNLATIPGNFLKAFVGDVFNPGGLTEATLTQSQKDYLKQKALEKGGERGFLSYDDYGIKLKPTELITKSFTDPTALSTALTAGGVSYNIPKVGPQTGEPQFTGLTYDWDGALPFIDKGGVMGMASRGVDKVFDWTAAKGGVARKKYYKGSNGILDIDEESEDISLTAFNPKFDDVPELTEEKEEEKISLFSETEESDPLNELILAEDGVTTLFRAKNGGNATKNIKGQPHMLAYITPGEAKTLENLGGQKTMTKEGIPAYPPSDNYGGSWGGSSNEDKGETSSDSGWSPGAGSPGTTSSGGSAWTGGDDQEDDNAQMMKDMYKTSVTNISGGDIWDWDDTSEADEIVERKQNIESKAILFMRKNYPKSTIYAKDPNLWNQLQAIPTTPIGLAWAIGKDMYNTKELKNLMKEMEEAGLVGGPPGTNPTIYNEMWMHLENKKRKKDDKKDEGGPEVPEVPVAPVIQEIEDYTEMAWDPMSYLDKIRAGQAQRASLQAKGIIQDNETMTLNSGGLANLFRVKNY